MSNDDTYGNPQEIEEYETPQTFDEINAPFIRNEELSDIGAEWMVWDPEAKTLRAATPEELFDVGAKIEASDAARTIPTPAEHPSSVSVVPPPAAITAAKLTQ